MQQLTLYTTLGCHLCEDAKAIAEPMTTQLGLTLHEVEIADDPALLERYGIRIPVVQLDSGVELGWPFSREELRTWLSRYS